MTLNSDRWYWDPELIVRVQEFFGPSWELPFRMVTFLSDSAFILILVAVLFWMRGRRVAYTVLAAVMIGALITTVLKLGVDVARPEHAELITYESRISPAFPSGHAMHVVAFWGMLVYFGIVRVWTAVAIAVVVMTSRLFLGIHYPADLFVGAGIGLIGIVIGHNVLTRVYSRLTDQQMSYLVASGFLGSVVMVPVAGSFPLGWEIMGGLLGAGVGTLIESQRINYHPVTGPPNAHLIRLAVGGSGVVFFVLFALLAREMAGGVLLRVLVMFPLGLWLMWVTPYILDRLGLSESTEPATTQAMQASQP